MLGDYHVKIWALAAAMLLMSVWIFVNRSTLHPELQQRACLAVLLHGEPPVGWMAGVRAAPDASLLCRIAANVQTHRILRHQGTLHGH